GPDGHHAARFSNTTAHRPRPLHDPAGFLIEAAPEPRRREGHHAARFSNAIVKPIRYLACNGINELARAQPGIPPDEWPLKRSTRSPLLPGRGVGQAAPTI